MWRYPSVRVSEPHTRQSHNSPYHFVHSRDRKIIISRWHESLLLLEQQQPQRQAEIQHGPDLHVLADLDHSVRATCRTRAQIGVAELGRVQCQEDGERHKVASIQPNSLSRRDTTRCTHLHKYASMPKHCVCVCVCVCVRARKAHLHQWHCI
jgi:hypothetical protein